MKAIERLKTRLEKYGVTIDEYEDTFYVDAPRGYKWWATDTHTLAVRWRNESGQTWLRDALKSLEEDIKDGLEKVIDPAELEATRWDMGDDTWGAAPDAPERIEFK